MSNMAQQQQDQQPQQQQLGGIHKYKISPPRFNGEYNTFEEWKYKMTAYLGLQDPDYNRLLRQSEQSTGSATNDQLEKAAHSQQVAEQWIQLSNNLHYILVSTCDGPASTICRQNMQGNGVETWRLIHARYSIPLGTRSVGHLTKLLKQQLDEQRFEESFKLSRYEQDNNTLLPDAIQIAVLLNETKGPLQQHLQLQAGNITTYAQIRSMVIEYYRATASFTRLQSITSGSKNNQGPAPMDIGATWYNKGKGKKGKHKGKGKHTTMPSASKTITSQKDAATSAAAENKRQSTAQSSEQQPKQKRTAEPTSPMATSPAHQKRPSCQHHRTHHRQTTHHSRETNP